MNDPRMLDEKFRAKVESGVLPVDCHDRVLRIAYVYLDKGLWDGNEVFDVVDKLHTRGWSFGSGDLKFNRTLDIFYLAQIAAGIYRSSDQLGEILQGEEFDIFYAQHHQLLNQDAWRQYYSPAFLAQPISARFYRLPDLQDLPDSSDPLGQPRQKGTIGHFTKLPRWAWNVVRTHRRQPTLPVATITQIALSTLQKAILHLRKDYPIVQPYSETQACFWLKYMGVDLPGPFVTKGIWNPNQFGIFVAQGAFDMWAWEAHYSQGLWDSIEARIAPLKPDLDGTRKSEVNSYGWPDGGVGVHAWWRGWEPELGSQEEIEFLTAVAVKETEAIDVSNLDYTMRSHMLLGVMRAAFETERGKHMQDLKWRITEAGRIDESRAEQWIQEVLMVMKPYVQKLDDDVWPAAAEDQSELLRHILMENGQLFARWKLSPVSKEFSFELKARK
ncbi:hypothetical protein AJ79_01027 [Helicocarpus griseus UAMH5409]|uniref:Rta1 domain-containing protein n=1 Tax=Helicocarpus griseus UAMH5409 TaxID=1447875 RepID=A0A2B7Y8U4_9EURO|nr:hypothetical protein AJ79_01027 [Helicocarpus griseus UAMH5409]